MMCISRFGRVSYGQPRKEPFWQLPTKERSGQKKIREERSRHAPLAIHISALRHDWAGNTEIRRD